MKSHPQWVSFRGISCKHLWEIDQTLRWKYFISFEMKSHVNTSNLLGYRDRGVVVITAAQFIQLSLNSDSVQVQNLLTACRDWSQLEIRLKAFHWLTIPQKPFIIIIIIIFIILIDLLRQFFLLVTPFSISVFAPNCHTQPFRELLEPLSSNPTKWLNTLKQFVGFCRLIVSVCLTILWGWCLKG